VSLNDAQCAVCGRSQGVMTVYCNRSWHSCSTGRNAQVILHMCSVSLYN